LADSSLTLVTPVSRALRQAIPDRAFAVVADDKLDEDVRIVVELDGGPMTITR
jgi:hypothetical protein